MYRLPSFWLLNPEQPNFKKSVDMETLCMNRAGDPDVITYLKELLTKRSKQHSNTSGSPLQNWKSYSNT